MTDNTPQDNNDLDLWANRQAQTDNQLNTGHGEIQVARGEAPTAAQIELLHETWRPSAARTLWNGKKFVRPWGLRHFLYAVVGVIVINVLAGIGLIGYAFSTLPASVLNDVASTTFGDALQKRVLEIAYMPAILFVLQLALYATWFIFIFWASFRKGARSLAKDFWLRFRWFDPLLGIGIAWGLLLLTQLLQTGIEALLPNEDYSGLDNAAPLTNATGIWFWLLAIGVVGIIGPFAEEMFFRGLLLQGVRRWLAHYAPTLTSRVINVIAVILSSIAFGFVHLNGVANFGQILVPFLTGGVGVVLAFITLRSKRMGINIFTHMAFNTTSVILAVLLPNMQ